MNAYYEQSANEIFPIFGVSSLDEAQQFASGNGRLVETDEAVYMNVATGSVDFASGWDEKDIESGAVVEVRFDVSEESWVEV